MKKIQMSMTYKTQTQTQTQNIKITTIYNSYFYLL